jgi:hypothetical protein
VGCAHLPHHCGKPPRNVDQGLQEKQVRSGQTNNGGHRCEAHVCSWTRSGGLEPSKPAASLTTGARQGLSPLDGSKEVCECVILITPSPGMRTASPGQTCTPAAG